MTTFIYTSVSYTLATGVDSVVVALGSANISLTGNELDNGLFGNPGNNALDGAGGSDTMSGGAGDDSYYVNSTGDVVIEYSNEGNDTVYSSITYYTLPANVENLTLNSPVCLGGFGNQEDNIITGNSQDNVLYGYDANAGGASNDGNDTLNGGAGADTMYGGQGNDTYVVDNAGDIVIDDSSGSGGVDLILSSVSFNIPSYVENITLTGSGNTDSVGNSLNNAMTGNGGDNTLAGGSGNDTLYGAAGSDTYYGGPGDDICFIDNVGDAIIESANAGNDIAYTSISYTLEANVDSIVMYATGNYNGTGNSLNNAIIGNGGDNVINGKAGMDYLTGGGGNDTFVFARGEAHGDQVTDFAGNGAAAGDSLQFSGWGAGSTFVQVDSTHWTIHDGVDAHEETIYLSNAPTIHASDYSFV